MNTVITKKAVVWTTVPLLAVSIAGAQYGNQDQDRNQKQHAQQKDSKQNEKRDAHKNQLQFVTLDEAQGMEVYSFSEQELGEIDDLIIERESGQIAYMLMSYGGTLGIGETVVAVPYHAFDVSVQNRQPRLRLNITENELSEAPEFDRGEWSDTDQDQWDQDLRKQWKKWTNGWGDDHNQRDRDLDRDRDRNMDRDRDMQNRDRDLNQRGDRNQDRSQRDDRRDARTMKTARFILGTELKDAAVRCGASNATRTEGRNIQDTERQQNRPATEQRQQNRQNQEDQAGMSDCGSVETVVMECTSGEIAFVSIDPDEQPLDIGETNRIVPFEVITIDRNGDVELSLTSEQLTSGTAMPDDTNRLNDKTYRSTLYKGYGVRERDFSKNAQGGWDKPEGAPGWTGDRSGSQNFETVTGEIVRMTTMQSPHETGEELQAIVIRTTDGKERTVGLAPKSFMEEQGITLRKGQQIGVETIVAEKQGRNMHLACSLTTAENTYRLRDRTGDAQWKRSRN